MAGVDARREWRVPRQMMVVKAVAAAVCVVLALIGDSYQTFLAGVAAAGFAALVLRDLLAPVRLAVDEGGVTVVSGFAGSERYSWNDVDRIRVDTRHRYGVTTRLLEIETGDQVHLFSRHDLGTPVIEVAEAVMRLRP
ncbi:PH domain-containing protein [Microtetraspora sp. AC03309]|uniref:PH domain-containing protein n=1 Tax=Microtetraspora sp. AC03309 TaxID=2779376 RepID=UPI001E5EEDFE|nr:PH domain-containing protein [Microtetraspora sp. AC03309]